MKAKRKLLEKLDDILVTGWIADVVEALYWLVKRRFTLKQFFGIVTGKLRITYHDPYDDEMWQDIYGGGG